jgi:hypothetical protein
MVCLKCSKGGGLSPAFSACPKPAYFLLWYSLLKHKGDIAQFFAKTPLAWRFVVVSMLRIQTRHPPFSRRYHPTVWSFLVHRISLRFAGWMAQLFSKSNPSIFPPSIPALLCSGFSRSFPAPT